MYRVIFIYFLVFALTFSLTWVIERRLIPLLSGKAEQPIYTEGPKWHEKKRGTPTMGGIAFVIATVLSCAAAIPFLYLIDGRAVLPLVICLAYALINAVIGFIDDAAKLAKGKNEGLTPRQKLLMQSVAAVAFLVARRYLLGEGTTISMPFGELDLGWAYYALCIVVLLGAVNCANLTDGIDGLASSVAFGIGVSLFYISAYLNPECATLAAALIGGSGAFLIFNLHPAKVFMGDTGSLFLGAVAVGAVFSLGNPLLTLFICGVYLIEGISVILQVLFYKATKRRLFLMAPIHHHLERRGLSENTICIVAILLTLLMSVPAYLLYTP